MKRLIVNADDFGAGPGRDEGILRAHRGGIVTSTSVLVTGTDFRSTLERLKTCPSLDTGLHLNLSEGSPVAPGHLTLVGPDGRFLGKDEARRRAAAGRFDLEEVERETEAQIAALQDAGLRVTHLDGHHHLHVYGGLPGPIARAASRRGIRCFRRPFETSDVDPDPRLAEYRRLASDASNTYALALMQTTDGFTGAALSGRLDEAALAGLLRGLQDGLTELMVHPGLPDASDGFSGPAREVELHALTAPGTASLIRDLQIRLVRFDEPT